MFFSFSLLFWDRLPKDVFSNFLKLVTQEACHQDRTYFIGYTKSASHKNCSISSYPKKDKQQPETRKKINSKMTEDSSIKRERNRVYK